MLDHPAHVPALVRGDERDPRPAAPGPSRPPDAMDVRLLVARRVEVHDVGDVLEVEPARGDVGRDEDVALAGREPRERALARCWVMSPWNACAPNPWTFSAPASRSAPRFVSRRSA